MLKNIWDKVTGNYRYIKYDGSEFHRKKGWSILDRPETKVGLACVAFNCASMAYLNNDFGHIMSGDFSMVSNLTKETTFKNLQSFSIGFVLCHALFSPYYVNYNFPKKGKAIDTYGTDLSRAQLSTKDLMDLKKTKARGIFFSIIYFSVFTSRLIGENASANPQIAMYTAMAYMAFERSSKILNGKYVICDDPPKKREKAKSNSTVYGGVNSPN